MVGWAAVDWGDEVEPLHRVDKLDGDGCEFYAVMSAVDLEEEWDGLRLLYVGLAYKQTVHKRITQDHRSWDLMCRYASEHRKEREVLVMLGRLHDYNAERVTKELVHDIEALLIFKNKPKMNKRSRDSYGGRPLVVVNGGDREPLRRIANPSDESRRAAKGLSTCGAGTAA